MKKLWGIVVLLPALMVGQGCGSSSKPTGKLTGTIKFQNQDVIVGVVTATPKDIKGGGVPAFALVKDGTYTIANAPAGEVVIKFSIPDLSMDQIKFEDKLPLGAEKIKADLEKKMIAQGRDKGELPSPKEDQSTEEMKNQKVALKPVVLKEMDPKQIRYATVEAGKETVLNITLNK